MGGGAGAQLDLSGTVWDEVGGLELSALMPDLARLSQGLEELFVAAEARPMRRRGAGSSGVRRAGPAVLDMRRTHAVSIGIANIKLRAAEVAARLRRLDFRAFSVEQLEALLAALPTDAELRALAAFVGARGGDPSELSLPEQYLLQLGGAGRPLRAVHVCMTLHTFEADARAVRRACELVAGACDELMRSDRCAGREQGRSTCRPARMLRAALVEPRRPCGAALPHTCAPASPALPPAPLRLTRLLGLILAVGNAMNDGTQYGGARGFFIDSLLRMASVKATSTGEQSQRKQAAPHP